MLTVSKCTVAYIRKGKETMNTVVARDIRVVLFDYGGVIAEEGFREGLTEIGRMNGLSPDAFFEQAAEAVYETGYVTGRIEESSYWAELRDRLGIEGSDEKLRKEILDRFVLRPWVFDIVRRLRDSGLRVAILSDQSNWLDELDKRDDFFKEFHSVFNSYHVGKGKRDPSLFEDVSRDLGVPHERILFIDDNEGHVTRAADLGFQVIHFRDKQSLIDGLKSLGLPI